MPRAREKVKRNRQTETRREINASESRNQSELQEYPIQETQQLKIEWVAINSLKPHPRNYRKHPPDQLEHIIASIKTHGFYRPIVTARDLTILAGHGVWEAAKKMGAQKVPVLRLDVSPDDPKALKLLVGDNELIRFAFPDDRLLTELLKEIRFTVGLEGTGFDDKQLAALVYITRPEDEIPDIDAAMYWVNMPDYTPEGVTYSSVKLIIQFPSVEDRNRFLSETRHLLKVTPSEAKTISTWYPPREKEGTSKLKFVG